MNVRWSLADLPELLAEVRIGRPFLIASPRWESLGLPDYVAWWAEVPSHRVEVPDEADGILAVGGGSTIDTAKFASAQSEKPVVHVPTTYSGAEWTTSYGIRSPDRVIKGGGGGARPVGIVYDVDLTLDLPNDVTAGTALNGLAHCAEALYVQSRNSAGDEQALAGAPLIAGALPPSAPCRRRVARELLAAPRTPGTPWASGAGARARDSAAEPTACRTVRRTLCLPPALELNRAFVPARSSVGGRSAATPSQDA
jgi:hypothetical protein